MTKLYRFLSWGSLLTVLSLVGAGIVAATAPAYDRVARFVEVAWSIAFPVSPRELNLAGLFAPVAMIPGQLASVRAFVTRQLQRSNERRASAPVGLVLQTC